MFTNIYFDIYGCQQDFSFLKNFGLFDLFTAEDDTLASFKKWFSPSRLTLQAYWHSTRLSEREGVYYLKRNTKDDGIMSKELYLRINT